MATEIDVKTMLADGWTVKIFRDEIDATVEGNPMRVSVWATLQKQLPPELYAPQLNDTYLHDVYAIETATGREYRFSRVQVVRIQGTLATPGNWSMLEQIGFFTYVAESCGEFYPATPFDGFLVAIEAGNLDAAAGLVDHLTELQAEGRIPSDTLTNARLKYLRTLVSLGLPDRGESAVIRSVVEMFGGSRTLPEVK